MSVSKLRAAVWIVLIGWSSAILAETKKELTWAGCGITKTAFMKELSAGFEKKTGIKIKLAGGGATKGIRSAASNQADIGGSCRHRLTVNGVVVGTELRTNMHHVAWDALVAVTHPSNPVADISTANLKKVYNARISNWKELGGANRKIIVAAREGKYSGAEQMFRALVFGYQEHEFLVKSKQFSSSEPLEAYVEQTPNTLAIDGVSSAKRGKVKILSLDGIPPTKANIADGRYPLFRPLYLVTNTQPSPEVAQLIEFALGPEGQKIISDQGTVNLQEGKGLVEPWKVIKAKYHL